MKTHHSFLLLCSLLLVCSTAYAATLYGLSEAVQLISIEPEKYTVTPIGKPILGELQAQNLASIDAKKGIYYFIGYNPQNETTQLLGLSLKDGSVVKRVDLPFEQEGFIGVGQYCNVDTNNGDVIVTGPLDANGPTHVMRIDMNTDLPVNIGIIEDLELGDFSAFDSNANVLYLEVYDEANDKFWIHGMDTKTGEIVNKIEDTTAYWLETMDFDPVTNKMYGIGINTSNSESTRRTLVSLDVKTGKFTQLSIIPNYWIISDSIAALDVKSRRLSVFLSPVGDDEKFDLVSVDIDTGKVLYTPHACNDDAECPWSIEYGI